MWPFAILSPQRSHKTLDEGENIVVHWSWHSRTRNFNAWYPRTARGLKMCNFERKVIGCRPNCDLNHARNMTFVTLKVHRKFFFYNTTHCGRSPIFVLRFDLFKTFKLKYLNFKSKRKINQKILEFQYLRSNISITDPKTRFTLVCTTWQSSNVL